MKPPTQLNVLDSHGGFTAESKMPYLRGILKPKRFDIAARLKANNQVLRIGDTLWRPGSILKDISGDLLAYNEKSFYQTNNDVTQAIYRVRGYNYPIIAWFDNSTKHRIA